MSKQHQTPHDKFFKKIFSDKRMAQEYFSKFLSSDLVQKLDLTQLELQAESYITNELKAYYSDLVYSCTFGNKGDKVLVTLLLEHKSQPEKYPHLQLLRYMLEIWSKQAQNKEKLTIIIPVIFYHGNKKWNKRSLWEYFDVQDEHLRTYLPLFNYHLTDLSKYSEEALQALQLSFLEKALLAMKNAFDKSYFDEKFSFFLKLHNKEESNFTEALLVYLFKITEIDTGKLITILDQSSKDAKSLIMSTYDLIVQQGIEKGIELRQSHKKIRVLIIRILQ